MKPHVTVVILNWNGWADTLECLESVFRLDYPHFTVVVCDNASADGSLERIEHWAGGRKPAPLPAGSQLAHLSRPPVSKPLSWVRHDRARAEAGGTARDRGCRLVLIQTGGNLGFAGGNNVGLRYALARGETDYVWLLNNDTVVASDALEPMVDQVEHNQGRATCGSRLLFYHDPETVQALGGASYNRWTGLARSVGLNLPATAPADPRHETALDYIMGASWLLPAAFLTDVGLMTESYFLYYEEIDWCRRGRRGYGLCYAHDSLVYHKEGRSIGSSSDKRKTSLLSDFYLFRNKIVFTRRHFPEALATVYLTTFLQALNRLRRGQPDKARLILNILGGQSRPSGKG